MNSRFVKNTPHNRKLIDDGTPGLFLRNSHFTTKKFAEEYGMSILWILFDTLQSIRNRGDSFPFVHADTVVEPFAENKSESESFLEWFH